MRNNLLDSPGGATQDGGEPQNTGWNDLLESLERRDFPWDGDYAIAAFDLIVAADESGIHDSAVVCLVAGYIAGVGRWARFTEHWNAVLKKNDVMDFHSKEFFAHNSAGRVGRYQSLSTGEKRSYGDWTDKQANSFIEALLGIIDTSGVFPIGGSVDVAAFRRLTYGERRFLTGGHFDGTAWRTSGAPSKPYFLVYDHCLVVAGNQTKPGLKTLFIFDEQKQYESRAIQQFGESLGAMGAQPPNSPGPPPNRFAGVLFRSRIGAPGLQAADLYAHCWYRYLTDEKNIGRQRRAALNVLTRTQKGMGYYNAEHFERMLSRLPSEVRAAIQATKPPNTEEP